MYKLYSVGELSKRFNYKSIEIRYTIYTKYRVKVNSNTNNNL